MRKPFTNEAQAIAGRKYLIDLIDQFGAATEADLRLFCGEIPAEADHAVGWREGTVFEVGEGSDGWYIYMNDPENLWPIRPYRKNVATKEYATLTLTVRLDPVPGAFHTKESAADILQFLLNQSIPHYEPKVTLAP